MLVYVIFRLIDMDRMYMLIKRKEDEKMATITEIKRAIDILSPAQFQEFCDSFLVKEGYDNIVGLGT